MKKTIYWGLIISLVLAIFLSPFASSWPDGLEKVAKNIGFLSKGEGTELFHSPIPDYAIPGIANEAVATALAGAVGTLIAFGIAYGVGVLVKKRTQASCDKRRKVGA